LYSISKYDTPVILLDFVNIDLDFLLVPCDEGI
jgi:hypothetical protein